MTDTPQNAPAPTVDNPGTGQGADAIIQAQYAALAAAQGNSAPVDPNIPDYMQGAPAAPATDPANPPAPAPASTDTPAPAATTEEPAPAADRPAYATDETAFAEAAKPFFEELTTTGNVSVASIQAAAEKFGVPAAVVQDYIEMAAAKQGITLTERKPGEAKTPAQPAPASDPAPAATNADTVVAIAKSYQAIGGEQNWPKFSEWMATTLSEASLQQYIAADSALRSRLITEVYAPAFSNSAAPAQKAPAAARDLTSGAPASNTPAAAANSGAQPFASPAEESQAFADRRYVAFGSEGDAYRRQVQARVMAGLLKGR